MFSNPLPFEKQSKDFVSTKEWAEVQCDFKLGQGNFLSCSMNMLANLIQINEWKSEAISLKSQENKKLIVFTSIIGCYHKQLMICFILLVQLFCILGTFYLNNSLYLPLYMPKQVIS